jgi:hypothetical protein
MAGTEDAVAVLVALQLQLEVLQVLDLMEEHLAVLIRHTEAAAAAAWDQLAQ